VIEHIRSAGMQFCNGMFCVFFFSTFYLTRDDFRGDEPMVVLDTLKDWRFKKNVRLFRFNKHFECVMTERVYLCSL